MKIGSVKILVSQCVAGVYLRWWYNGWHYFNFTNGYEIVMQTGSEGSQTTKMFSVISKTERPTKLTAEYSYQITLSGITPENLPGFIGLLMAEKVEQYENSIWYEVDITRGDHLIKDSGTSFYILDFEITRKDRSMTATVYQNLVKLYIGDTLCDLDDDEMVPLNKQVNDIAEMQDRQSDFTAQFKIRKTREMRALFELSGEVGASTNFPYENKSCKLIQDGIETITAGRIILDNSDDQYYYVSIYSGNLNFFDQISKLKITDLLLPSTNHNWNAVVQAATHIGDPDYVYPLCEPSDDGGLTPLTDDGDRIEMYGGWIWPFVKVKAIWDEIFSNAGYFYYGDITNDQLFTRLFMPIVNLKTAITKINDYHYSIVWQGRKDFTFVPLSPLDGMWGKTTLLNGDLLFKTYITYLTRYSATYKFRVQLNSAWDDGVPTHVYLFSSAVNVLELTLIWDSGTGGTIYEGEYAALVSEFLSIYISDQLAVEQYIISIVDITLAQINYGTDVTPAINLPDMTQVDFVKTICNMFGLIPDVTPRDHKIIFWNYLELYENIPYARDWSAYLSEDEDESEFKFGDYAQNNNLKYKNSSDVIQNNGNGIMLVDDETLQNQKDVMELPVSTCDEVVTLTNIFNVNLSRIAFNKYESKNVDILGFNNAAALPVTGDATKIYRTNDDGLLFKWNGAAYVSISVAMVGGMYYDQCTTIDPRIVYIDFIREIASPPYQKTFAIRTLIDGGTVYEITTPKKASSNEVAFSHLVKNYTGLSRLLTKTNLRRCKFNLPVYEVAGLKHYIPIYLSQYKAYFYVNKINNYVSGKLCTIDLIKL